MSSTAAFKAVPNAELEMVPKKENGTDTTDTVAVSPATTGGEVKSATTTTVHPVVEEAKAKESTELKDAKGMGFFALMKVLKPFFWPEAGSEGALVNRIRATSTWAATILSKTSSLLAPFFLLDATNQLIVNDYDSAYPNIIYFVLLKISSSFFKEVQGILYIKVKQQALIQLQRYTFQHLHNLSLSWHLNKKSGAVMKSMDRGIEATNQLVTYMFLFLIPALGECLAVMILFFTKFKDLWLIGVTIGIAVAIYILVTVRITIWRKKFREGTNKHDNEFHDKAMDSITNFETVKYFTAESYEVNRYAKSVVKYQQFNAATLVSMQALNFAQNVILNSCLVACLLVSGKAVVNGEMTVGAWVAVQTWILQIFQPLNFLGTVYSMIIQALIDVRNLSDLLSEKMDIVDSPDAQHIPYYNAQKARLRATSDANAESLILADGSPVSSSSSSSIDKEAKATTADQDKVNEKDIEIGQVITRSGSGNNDMPVVDISKGVGLAFENVHFNYPSQPIERGLKGVTFTVDPGTTTAVVGSTGAGKTTLSRLVFRFYEPRIGKVLLGGYNIRECTQQSVRSCIGVVPQDTVMFNESILYNIRYGRLDATDEEVYAAAEAAQIRAFVDTLPEKWQTVVGERGLKLSGGEKQRVAIARCLLKNPPVVLLDEATSALDTVTENSVQEALDALGQNRTVIIIAHRLSTIRHADQILVMNDGCIVESGCHEQLLDIEDGVYKKLWDMQDRKHEPILAIHDVTTAEVIIDALDATAVTGSSSP